MIPTTTTTDTMNCNGFQKYIKDCLSQVVVAGLDASNEAGEPIDESMEYNFPANET